MDNVEIPVPGLVPEGQEPPQEPPAPAAEGGEVQPQAEDFIAYKYRDKEVPIPLQAAEQVAAAIGWKGGAQALVNQLQIAQDAKDFYDAGRRYYQTTQAPNAPVQPSGYPQQPQPQYRQQPQYQPPVQAPPEDGPDPIAILQQLNQKVSAFDAYVQEQRAQREYENQRQMQNLERQAAAEHREFADALAAKGIPRDRIPDMWTLLQQGQEIGMLAAHTQPKEVFNRVYRMNYADDLVTYGVQSQMQRLRDPKAQVTVPAAKQPVPAPPSQTNAEQMLGDMKWSDALQFVPEARR